MIERSQLSEMNPGVVDGMSVEEIQKRYPDEWERKQKEVRSLFPLSVLGLTDCLSVQPYSHRFPRAESYHDLSVSAPASQHITLPSAS